MPPITAQGPRRQSSARLIAMNAAPRATEPVKWPSNPAMKGTSWKWCPAVPIPTDWASPCEGAHGFLVKMPTVIIQTANTSPAIRPGRIQWPAPRPEDSVTCADIFSCLRADELIDPLLFELLATAPA